MGKVAIDLDGALARVRGARPYRAEGVVRRVVGLAVESEGPPSSVGEECLLIGSEGKVLSRAQVVGFSGNRVFTMPVERLSGVATGTRVLSLGRRPTVGVGPHLLGRILDADGGALDGLPLASPVEERDLESVAPAAMNRARIRDSFATGIRTIDSMLALGRGQRVGIFAGSGVGKSTLLGMIARHTEADVAVIALVGERGREVREFLDEDLGAEGLKRSVVFVATSDEPPLRRIRAAHAAMAAAEYFRDQGRQVVFLMDSVTRVAMAQREVGLSLGEPPSTKGYPPSVFSLLPRLLERAGAVRGSGSITGLFAVYVEADDLNDPIGDAARSLLDGHIVLDRDLADRGFYPAIDVLGSVSRLAPQVTSPEQQKAVQAMRSRLAARREAEDLIMLGAYRQGTDAEVDAALRSRDQIRELLTQPKNEGSAPDATLAKLIAAVHAGDEPAPSVGVEAVQ